MKKRSFIVFGLILIVVAGIAASPYLHIAAGQNDKQTATERAVTVTGGKRAFPRANFEDGREIGQQQEAKGTSGRALASGDFDSDGTADIVTVESTGLIRFHKGNVDSIYPNSPQAKVRKDNGIFADTAFFESSTAVSLPISPDFFAAGDFNADGRQDVITAAKGSSAMYLLTGDGNGNLTLAKEISITGSITALLAGEIGRPDGQTDIAVTVTRKGTASLLVFEHPEGAFARKPEEINLSSAANAIAIGRLDSDIFRDIAVASDNKLTIVRGRGQAYPWDMVADSGITRPKAMYSTRSMPFSIAAMEIGDFSDQQNDSLAMLTTSGSIEVILVPEPAKRAIPASETKRNDGEAFYAPAGLQSRRFRSGVKISTPDPTAADAPVLYPADPEEREAFIAERRVKADDDFAKMTPAEQKAQMETALRKGSNDRERAKAGFLNAISPAAAEPLSRWGLNRLTLDSRLANAAASTHFGVTMTKVRISDSGRDELAFTDSLSNKLHLLIRETKAPSGEILPTETVSLDMDTRPTAITSMRLNSDGISDLVVLREGSASPTTILSAPVATIVVTSASDGANCEPGNCTLRGALFIADGSVGPDMITFNMTGGTTISPASQFDTVQHAVTIDATTQPGYAGAPVVEIEGTQLAAGKDGLQIAGSNSVVRGLAINRIKGQYDSNQGAYVGGNGLVIARFTGSLSVRNVIVEGNYLGTDPTGMIDRGNDYTALNIYDSTHNTIGGTTPAARNILSGSGTNNDPNISPQAEGVGIAFRAGMDNVVQGNYIGTDATGAGKINNTIGIRLGGGRNQIGGDAPGAGNVISGNGDRYQHSRPDACIGQGVWEETLVNLDEDEFLTTGNSYKGNRIGTNADGTAALANCSVGLLSNPRHSSLVGSITELGRNTISGNRENGIYCTPIPRSFDFVDMGVPIPEGFCNISGNNIGTSTDGNIAIPNIDYNYYGSFVLYFGTTVVQNTDTFSNVGAPGGTSIGACTGFCNLISGNGPVTSGTEGVYRGSRDGEVGVFNNFIGTNRSGSAPLSNGNGFRSDEGGLTRVGAVGIDEGGGFVPLGNLISGNRFQAIVFNMSFAQSLVPQRIEGNLIGTNAAGLTAIPNGTSDATSTAVGLVGTSATVGSSDPLARNIISGNAGSGIFVSGNGRLPVIANNYIGVNKNGQPLGNGANGIHLNASNVTIGGSPETANVIANNGANGIYMFARLNFSSVPAIRNPIRINSIYGNGALGIDLTVRPSLPLTPDGPTPNDCLDVDSLANERQNFPVLTAPVFNGNGTVTIEGAFQSAVSESFMIDFYSNSTADKSNYGEGQTYIGSKLVNTDSSGLSTFLFTSTIPVAPGLKITATATDSAGNTSEFSCFAGQCEGGTGGLAGLVEAMGLECLSPIIVNIDTDEEDTSPGNEICDVNLSMPGLQCSLRAAIDTANNKSGFDLITFDIPSGGVKTISPGTELPPITDRVSIDATSQPGYSGSPVIQVQGSTLLAYCLGLGAGSSDSSIIGFSLNRCHVGIQIESARNKITKSYIGLGPDGNAAGTPGEQQFGGVFIQHSTAVDNIVGGSFSSDGNVISNYVHGVIMLGGTTGNRVRNNKIGTNPAGTVSIPNGAGVTIEGSNSNSVGDEAGESGNLISGNAGIGVIVRAGAATNQILGNKIGTTPDGTGVLPNGTHGILFDTGAKENTVKNNAIGGHDQTPNSAGIVLLPEAGMSNRVLDNTIGVSGLDGEHSIPNNYGVAIFADSQVIGAEGEMNLISRNKEAGIYVSSLSDGPNTVVEGNVISYNLVGTNSLNQDQGNEKYGIRLNGEVKGTNVTANFVSSNTFVGIALTDGPSENTIETNFVGVAVNGTSDLGNGIGIWVRQASNNTLKTNLVSGNDIGILVGTNIGLGETRGLTRRYVPEVTTLNRGETYTEGNVFTSNTVGLNLQRNAAVPNSFGIAVGENARNNQIGLPGAYNLVSGNTNTVGYGIFLGTLAENPSEEIVPQLNKIQANIIGLDGQLQTTIANKLGFVLLQAKDNLIGGETSDLGNIIVGSTSDGVQATGSLWRNDFINNHLGVLPAAANRPAHSYRMAPNGSSYGNGGNGISVIGNTIKTRIFDNVIGNNAGSGIYIESSAVPAPGETHTEIAGNSVGVIYDPFAENYVSIGNTLSGILIKQTKGVKVGGASSGLGNIIGSNLRHGIEIEDSNPTTGAEPPTVIQGNSVGAALFAKAANGVSNLSNRLIGISAKNSKKVRIGSGNVGSLVGNNLGGGIVVEDCEDVTVESNTVVKNQIVGIKAIRAARALIKGNGVGVGELAGLSGNTFGNIGDGVVAEESPGAIIGGDTPDTWNISGNNTGAGIALKATHSTPQVPEPTVISGNLVGGRLSSFGSIASRASNAIGVLVENSSNVRVGSTNPNGGNSVVASTSTGLRVRGALSSSISAVNNVLGKVATHHGTDGEPMGNGEDGVLIEDGAEDNAIGDGGTQAPRLRAQGGPSNGNTITGNSQNGITLSSTAGRNNRIGNNRIYGNIGLGIDIGRDGPTINDLHDPDTGPNKLQNYPVIGSASTTGGILRLSFNVDSAPANSDYGTGGIRVEFFRADAGGEGEHFIGAVYYTAADYAGGSPGMKTVDLGPIATLGISINDRITSTATDASGNTSEFAPTFSLLPTAAGVSISGRVMTADGRGVRQAVVTMVDPSGATRSVLSGVNGAFVFADVETGHTYIISVRSRRFNFAPRTVEVFENVTGLDFTPE